MTTIACQLEARLARSIRLTDRLKAAASGYRLTRRLAEAIDFLARGIFHVVRNRRYLTALKLLNMAIVNLEFYFKTERLIGRPYRMKIESTNICNTRCQLCPTGLGIQGRPKGSLGLADFQKLVAQLKRYLYVLDLSMWGDPLIVPDIYKMIRYAHDQRIWTYLSSNLHAFKPEKGQAEALIRSGLDMLTCSIHGASQATFEQYQPGKHLPQTLDKVRAIVEARRRLGSSTPVIQLNFVVTRQNEHEQDAFRRLAQELDCNPVFSEPSVNARFLGLDQKLVSLNLADDVLKQKTRAHLEKWLPRDPKYVLEPYRRMLASDGSFDAQEWNGKKLYNCSWPWQASVINWDGTVSLCCGSFDPGEDLGNVFTQPFAQIWNSRKYRMARRSFKQPLSSEQAKDVGCANCPGFMI
ncbi:MAG: SPASM domain-containing protein [Phycisphaeraceae bacterium]|nr:SPASM domain-containing protein [Phycisphaeraceae bacterium]